jgi:hypothetical protein
LALVYRMQQIVHGWGPAMEIAAAAVKRPVDLPPDLKGEANAIARELQARIEERAALVEGPAPAPEERAARVAVVHAAVEDLERRRLAVFDAARRRGGNRDGSYDTRLLPRAADLAEVQACLPPGVALVEFTWQDHRTHRGVL